MMERIQGISFGGPGDVAAGGGGGGGGGGNEDDRKDKNKKTKPMSKKLSTSISQCSSKLTEILMASQAR